MKKQAKPVLFAHSDWRGVPLTTEEAGAVIKVGAERVRQLTKLGWIKKAGPNTYRLGDLIDGALAYRDDQAKKVDADSEQAKLAASRRREIEMRIAREETELVPKDDAIFVMDEFAGAVVAELSIIPARFTRDVAERSRLKKAVDDALERVASKMAACAVSLSVRDARG